MFSLLERLMQRNKSLYFVQDIDFLSIFFPHCPLIFFYIRSIFLVGAGFRDETIDPQFHPSLNNP